MDKHKNNITAILQTTNATPFTRHGDVAFACCFCKNKYMDPKELKTHTIENHNEAEFNDICKGKALQFYLMKLDITDLVCNICNKPINTLNELYDHLEGHGKKIHTDINSRIIPFRFDTDKHVCAICSDVFCKYKDLRQHLNTHFRNYVCKFCDAGFVTMATLASHEAIHKIGTYACDFCGKKFYRCRSKKVHEKLIHRHQYREENIKRDDKASGNQQKSKAEKKKEKEKHRDNILVVLENTNATPFGKCTDAGYDCLFCTQKYFNPKDLKEHTSTTHTMDDFIKIFSKPVRLGAYIVKLDVTDLFCKICNNQIDSWDKLFDHLANHNKVIYRDINNHIIPFMFDSDKKVCAICKHVYHKVKLLREHMNIHFSNYICDVCNAGFITERMRSAHMQCHKTGVFNCGFCEKSFTTDRSKKAHEKMVHLKLNYATRCGLCKIQFKTNKHKNDHLTAVHGITLNELNCSACDRTFKHQTQLTTHVKRDHLMERNYKCNECGRAFFCKLSLKTHMGKHCGIRNFECEVCKKTFACSKSLRKHMRIHVDGRRFKCDRCGTGFVQKANWLNHMRKKHNEVIE